MTTGEQDGGHPAAPLATEHAALGTSSTLPRWLAAAVVLGTFCVLSVLERRRPLRMRREPQLPREIRNLAIAGLGAATVQVLERPVAEGLARLVERRGWGLVKRMRLPRWLETAVAVALLDYTLFLWHVLTHRVPQLWRFHAVHHADRDMDASTAVRFHFGELAISIAWRAGQIVAIGVSPFALSLWQTATLVSVLFHHSNLRLPDEVEERLALFVVTPGMHGIHHSIERDEQNSNWSSGLSVWDRVHGTLRFDRARDTRVLGVEGFDEAVDVTIGRMLAAPFAAGGGHD
jgi:sterol desaturase/sphingolipid hydroxylase (fatty acid hydroxylase superfamily)